MDTGALDSTDPPDPSPQANESDLPTIVGLNARSGQKNPLELLGELAKASSVSPMPEPMPETIGRYRVERLLGVGSFGRVYLAHDDQLMRDVAIKVPRNTLVMDPASMEEFLHEARAAAKLNHPNIVPVFDVGSSDSCPCFVVSKFIEGFDLEVRIQTQTLSMMKSVEIVATVAEALHYAHKQGMVHRDIKPGNVLIDNEDDRPMIADFGLVLREQDLGTGARLAGTPSYMSPEQARGEAHRVDGRADIFSLGVVMYVLLTGRRPFTGTTQEEVLEQVRNLDPRPMRSIDENISKELERICSKAMSKRAADRYSVANDMANDLRAYLADSQAKSGALTNAGNEATPPSLELLTESKTVASTGTQPKNSAANQIVPKGLRSFDASDSEFFLDLLPGPHGRDGLPESIRFWKSRIETRNPDEGFAVGMIYGPSGCGKTSLVKAGLLPRIDPSVKVIYVETSSDKTETTLLKMLQRRFPELSQTLSLADSLNAIRQGKAQRGDEKVLLVLDQFEQWLHGNGAKNDTELVQALRQCDGSRLQAIIMVRDDFWMAATRFMRELEIPILDGVNSAAVDLFPLRHAQRVLTAFGRAYGELPATGELSKPQQKFIEDVVAGLAQDGKVISVRLTLFAEMFKGKRWDSNTLRDIGGTEGVGAAFLEENFSERSALPARRAQRVAAQAVLRALLPESGVDIKGHMRSRMQLQLVAGDENKPRDFEELIQILDRELRLITPVDLAITSDGKATVATSDGYYQLAHDYLVSSLRDWLTSKQKETAKGRARLLLIEQANNWQQRQDQRQLPSRFQWLQIRLQTSRSTWTQSQRLMMRTAGKKYAVRFAINMVLLIALVYGSREFYLHTRAQTLMEKLSTAKIDEVPKILGEMADYQKWLSLSLAEKLNLAQIEGKKSKQMLYQLALLPSDSSHATELCDVMLRADPGEFEVIRDALVETQERHVDKLWKVLGSQAATKHSERLRAAAALAKYAPHDPRWNEMNTVVVSDLVQENSIFIGAWSKALYSVREPLLKPLVAVFNQHDNDHSNQRTVATSLLLDFSADNVPVLFDLLLSADKEQFHEVLSVLMPHKEKVIQLLLDKLDVQSPPNALAAQRDERAKQQASAAVALVQLDYAAKIWPLLKHSQDPSLRSYIIDRLASFGVDPALLVAQEAVAKDVSIHCAILLALGEYPLEQIPADLREAVTKRAKDIFQTDPDAGLHASAQWLLQQWGEKKWLDTTRAVMRDNPQTQAQRIATLKLASESSKDAANIFAPRWIMNTQGQTEVVIFGPVQFMMGSSEKVGGTSAETQHPVKISHSFVMGAMEITLAEYRRMSPDYLNDPNEKGWNVRSGDIPVVALNWFMAARYCNWLSQQEGIAKDQWCFEIGNNENDVQIKPNYQNLKGYRLPTEAEMEFAVRANSATDYYFGDAPELLGKYAWYQANSQSKGWPVGMLKPNDFGLFDSAGNVWEWCADWLGPYPSTLVVDPQGPATGTKRVLRGGDEYYGAETDLCRAWCRGSRTADYRGLFSGFRVARTP